MRRISKVLLFLAVLLIPMSVSAANILVVSDNIAVNDEQNIFRFRNDPGIWQRSTLEADEIVSALEYENSIFVVLKKDQEWFLYSSDNGLSYQERWRAAELIKMKISDGKLLAVSEEKATIVSNDLSLDLVNLPGHTYSNPEDYLFNVGERLLFFVDTASGIDVYDLLVSTTVPSWSYRCSSSLFIPDPSPTVVCDNIVYTFKDQPTTVIEDVNYISNSKSISYWQSISDNKNYYIYNGTDLTSLRFNDVEAGDKFLVVGDRLFWSKTASVFEVAWLSDPVAVFELPINGSLRASNNDQLVVLEDNLEQFYSKSYSSWIKTNIDDSYEFINTTKDLIAYLPEGSETFFEDSPGSFVEMDSSWSTSSKIKTIKDLNNKLVLVLRNSSNNPNIYVSSDYKNWKRRTMPSSPTHLVDIKTARNLPANTLVELFGSISVLPGFVSSSISYIADEIASVQLFLSPSKGVIDISQPVKVTAIGKISSSSTKRILLDSAKHIIVGDKVSVASTKTTISKAKNTLGRTYILEGKLSDISKNSAVLVDDTASLKLHLDGIKEAYIKDDVISVETVVDYNSSSKKVEAWFIGGENKLVHRAVIEKPQEKKKKDSKKVAKPKKEVTTKKAVPTFVSEPVKTVVVPDNPVKLADDIAGDSEDKVKVSGVSSRQLPEWIMFLAGFLAGGLVIRGSRFKKILE